MKTDRVAIALIEGMIEQNLQLGWDHLQNGQCDLALHEFHEACQKVEEIRVLIAGPGADRPLKRVNASNPIEPSNGSTHNHEAGTDQQTN